MSRNGRPRKTGGVVFARSDSASLWVRYRDRDGKIIKESTDTADPDEAAAFLRGRCEDRDRGRLPVILAAKYLTFSQWADWFLEKRSKPPYRAQKTHEQNMNATKLLRPVFGDMRLADITPESIENYIDRRLNEGRRTYTKLLGLVHRGRLKPATVHQEFRVLRRMLNLAVKQKKLQTNPCDAVEFPVSVKQSTRKPHYLTANEQERIEFFAPGYLKNAVLIITEMGLRPYKELMPMLKSQVDIENRLVHIADSKTVTGIGDMPMTDLAHQAFKAQMDESLDSDYVFPTLSPRATKPYIGSLKKAWSTALRRAKVPYFSLYELRHTFATRLSAGGVADHFVTLMLRQGDAEVFKRYSQAKLAMMREALAKLDRNANQHQTFGTALQN
ncbi:MAG TPA: tyrosine-type recombinase/integrase [Terriglobia bacterium]|nr:tyrosine-type recombinase/integrase [Terriglobia bacterium]